ncbi:hypothetical protein ACFY3U_02675 [Micromonospora sp. NPDC000089]|uniref:hypothetical protein n=1 Tax=unclassified Micromonospora TaxID=2617518 RepID=UPI0036A157C8
MADTTQADLLAGFTVSRPYTMDVVADAPRAPGVLLVSAGDTVVHVERAASLRDRLREHLTGSRAASVLHGRVGQLLDDAGPPATAADIASWLARCIVRWRESSDPEADAAALVAALGPRFHPRLPQPRA